MQYHDVYKLNLPFKFKAVFHLKCYYQNIMCDFPNLAFFSIYYQPQHNYNMRFK